MVTQSLTNVAGDNMNLNMIEDHFFYGTDIEQAKDKDNLDEILVSDRNCRIN